MIEDRIVDQRRTRGSPVAGRPVALFAAFIRVQVARPGSGMFRRETRRAEGRDRARHRHRESGSCGESARREAGPKSGPTGSYVDVGASWHHRRRAAVRSAPDFIRTSSAGGGGGRGEPDVRWTSRRRNRARRRTRRDRRSSGCFVAVRNVVDLAERRRVWRGDQAGDDASPGAASAVRRRATPATGSSTVLGSCPQRQGTPHQNRCWDRLSRAARPRICQLASDGNNDRERMRLRILHLFPSIAGTSATNRNT